jgi:hypothetical protein
LGEFVPGADVVEALEEGLRPEPLPDIVPTVEESAVEDPEADVDRDEPEAGADEAVGAGDAPDAAVVPDEVAEAVADDHASSVDGDEDASVDEDSPAATTDPGDVVPASDDDAGLLQVRLGDDVVTYDGDAPDLTAAADAEIDLTAIDLSGDEARSADEESDAPAETLSDTAETAGADPSGDGRDLLSAEAGSPGDVENEADVTVEPPSSPVVAPLRGPVATIRHDEPDAPEPAAGSVTFRSTPIGGGSEVEAPASMELAEGEAPAPAVTGPPTSGPGHP